ncbi:hypothetical protein N658DRAFT_420574 [Parathielavia hyrcaniae]|uniref:Uncharacterized protein n=1 Tax=Parathielavia hyrcaniae TaxID=113614 RepID=A0AAN6Q9Q3_9PEZI|nr:hypothetical protein N658DRAFT_420574 [Parathielavia hyrcaniae]
MPVAELSSDDEPARAVAPAGLATPCPARIVPGSRRQTGRHGISKSSGDEKDETIEDPNLGERQGIEPDVLNPEKTQGGSRPQSPLASSFANAAIVPRSQRRGLLGRLTLIPEVERPYEYKNSTKWMITAVVALAAAAAPMGSGIFLRE